MTTDTPNLKISVTAQRNMLGRKSNQFIATLGDTGISAIGTCRTGALQLLHSDLTRSRENEFRRHYIRKGNVTFALFYAGGWCYDIVRDDGKASSSHLSTPNYRDALEAMERHAAQHDGV